MAKQFRFLLSIIMLAMMGSGALAATNYSALMTSNMGLSTADQGFSNNYGTATKVLRSNSLIKCDAFLAERVDISSTTRPKYAGVATLTVPAGTKKVHFHAVGYAGGAKPDLRVNLQGSSNILLRDSLPLDPGFASTTATYYELQLSPTSAYYSITFSTIPQEDVQLVFLSTNAVRFLLYGVNAETSKVYKLNYYNGDSQVASTFTQTGSNKYTLSANPYPTMGMWLTLEYNNQQTIYALVGDNATLNRYNSTNVQLKANGADWKVPEHQNADLTFTIDDSGSAPVLSITGWPEPTLYLDSDRESSNQILNVDEPLQKDASGLYTRVVTVPESFIDTFSFSFRDEDYTYFGASDYPDVTESNFGEEVEMYPGGPGRITVFPRGTFKITLDASNLLAVKVKVEQYVPDSYRISADQGTGSAEFFDMEQREDGTFYSQVIVSGDHMDMQVLDQNGHTYGTISDEPDGVQGKTVQLGIAGTVETWVMRISAPGTYDVVLDPATMTLSVQEVAKKYFIQQHQPTGEDLEMTKNGDIYYKRIVLPGDYYLFQLMDENGHTIAVTTEADGVGIQGKTIQVSNDSEVLKYMMSVTEPGPSIFYVKFIPSTMQLSVPLADTYWLTSDTQAGTELLAGNMVKQADGTYTKTFTVTQEFLDANDGSLGFSIGDNCDGVFGYNSDDNVVSGGVSNMQLEELGQKRLAISEADTYTVTFDPVTLLVSVAKGNPGKKYYLVMNDDVSNKKELTFSSQIGEGSYSYELDETMYLPEGVTFYVLDEAGIKIGHPGESVYALPPNAASWVAPGDASLTIEEPGLYKLGLFALASGDYNFVTNKQKYYWTNTEEELTYDPERQAFVITKDFPDATFDMQFWIQDASGNVFNHSGGYYDITADGCVDIPVTSAITGNANFRMTEEGRWTIIFKVTDNGMTLSAEKYQPKFYLVMNNDQANKLEFKFDYVEESSGMTSYQLAETIYLQNSDRFYVLDDAGNKISGDFDGVMSLGESSTAQVGYGNGDLTVNVPGLYVLRFLVLEDGSFNLASLRQRYYWNNSEEEFVYDPERQGFVITKTFPDAVYDMQFWIQDFDGIIFGHPGSYGDITDDYCVDLPVERAYSSGNASNFRMTEAGTYTIIFKVSSNGKTLSVEKYQPKFYLVLNNDEANKIELIADGENLFKAADAVYIPKGAPIYLLDGAGNKMGVGIEGYTHPEEAVNGGSRMQEGGFAFSLQRPGFYEVQYRIENEIPWFEWLEVEKQFYVVGDMNNWSLDSFIPMTRNEQTGAYEYEFTVGSDVSQYYFTITDVNNGTWDIPHYGIAPSTGGEEANLLTADNPTVQLQKFTDGSLKIADPGTYKLSLDPATMQLTVSGWPKSYYVWIPSLDGWSYDKSQLRELTYNAQTNAYELETNQEVSWQMFYLVDAKVETIWNPSTGHVYGIAGYSDTTPTTEFSPESPSVVVAPVTSTTYGFVLDRAGNYKISLNAETMELSVSGYKQFYADVINDSWTDLDSVVELVFNKSTATYEGEVEIAFEGGYTWKNMLITDGPHSTWSEMWNHTRYAPLANYTYDASNNTVQMGPNGAGGQVVFAQEGKFKLSLAVTGPDGNLTYTLTITEDVQPTDIDALANAIYVEQVEGVPGGTAQLDIQMKNADYTPVGCTFDIVLPEGFSLATDDAGEIIYTLGGRASRMNAIVVANSNNTYNVALQPASGTAVISDTEGTILSFTLQIPEDAAIGEYPVKLERNLIQYKPAEGGATSDAVLSDVTAICQVDDFMLGDVNGDRQITPTDATMILMYYFNIPQTGFIVRAADVTQDGNISPADSIEDLLIYFGSAAGAKQAPAFELDEEVIMKDPE